MDPIKFARLLPLASKALSELTLSDLEMAAEVLDIRVDVTDELRRAALAMLQGKGINTVVELIQSPESLHQLVSLFRRPSVQPPDERLVRCKICKEFFLVSR